MKYFVSCTSTYTNFGRQRVWRRNLDYVKNLQAKYFTGENTPIYGIFISIFLVLEATVPKGSNDLISLGSHILVVPELALE